MSKYLNLIKTVLLLSAFVFLLSFTNKRNNERTVNKILFERDEENFIKNEVLEKVINKYSLSELGAKTNQVDLNFIEKKLDNYSFIKKAEIFTTPEGFIKAKITEEKPLVRIQTPVKEFYLTDESKAINTSKLYSADVMMVSGNVTKEEYVKLTQLVEYINDDNLLKNHIIGIKKEGRNFYTFMTNMEYAIEFGSLTKIAEKFSHLKLFYNQYLSKTPSGRYRKISVRFNNQIVAIK